MTESYIILEVTQRLENLVGAFAANIADAVLEAAQGEISVAGPSAAALALIEHVPGVSIERIRNGLGLTHAGTVRLIDRLERAGLVQRRSSEDDKRSVALDLTDDGEAVCAAILSKRQSVLQTSLRSLSSEEKQTLELILEKLLKSTVKDVAHAYAICRLCDASVCEFCPVEAGLEPRPVT